MVKLPTKTTYQTKDLGMRQTMKAVVILLLAACGVRAFDGLPPDYESWSAEEKYLFWDGTLEEEAIQNLSKSPAEKSGNFPSAIEKLLFLTVDNFSPTFERFRDDLPYTHAKRIRSVGAVGLVAWKPTPEPDFNPYTGFYATGTPYALIRLSYTSPNDESGTTPGLSLKLFRDGMPSSNLLAMESLEGQSSGNFFQFDFSNHLAPAKTPLLKYVGRRFSQYSCPTTRTGLSEAALSTETLANMNPALGSIQETVDSMEFPFRIIFRPNPALTQQFESYPPEGDLFAMLTVIPVATKLYDVYAVEGPGEDGEGEIHLGHLELTRALQPSVIGDKVLFFRHQKIEEDYVLRPRYNVQDEGTPRCPAGY
jgi:hypothetical protein